VSLQQQYSSHGSVILHPTEVQVSYFELATLTRNEFGYYYPCSVALPMLLPTESG
jgi:hypothetical protein